MQQYHARISGTGYADIKLGYEEVIDTFSVTKTLVQNSNNIYYLPSQTTTGDDYYLLNKVLCYDGGVLKGQAEKVSINKIDLLTKSLLTSPSSQYPEDVASYLKYKKETGRGFEDYAKLH